MDRHRHLSHLVGLYPGYAIAEYDPALQGGRYTRQEILDAAAVTLVHRGKGTGADGDAGWEKMWRAAAWAQLGDAKEFYHLLTVGSSLYVFFFSWWWTHEVFPVCYRT